MTDLLNISILQYDIKWEDKEYNLSKITSLIKETSEFNPDIIMLPEMFSTGFSMNISLAENKDDKTIKSIKNLAIEHNTAIFGSFMCSESGKLFNRAFFITPDSEYYYDKKHLFRMGEIGRAHV